MKEVLLLLPQVCCPPADGGKQDLYYRVRALSKFANVHIVMINSNDSITHKDDESYKMLHKHAANIIVFPRLNKIINNNETSFMAKVFEITKWFVSGKPRNAQIFESKNVKILIRDYILHNNIKTVVLESPFMNELIDIKYLRELGIKIICVMHNVEYILIRDNINVLNWKRNILLYDVERLKQYEFNVIQNVDISIGISARDVIYMKEQTGLNNVVYLPTLLPKPPTGWQDHSGSNYIIFTGGLSFFPNFHGISWFLETVFQKYITRYPDIVLIITGSTPVEVRNKLEKYKNVEFTGFVSRTQLEALITNSLFMIVPIIKGSGVKIKLIEAMSYSVPAVVTSEVAKGIPYPNNKCPFIVANTDSEFLQGMYKLTEDGDLRLSYAKFADEYFTNNYWDDQNVCKWVEYL